MQTLGLTQIRNREAGRVKNIFLPIFSFHVSGYFYFMETELGEHPLSWGQGYSYLAMSEND